MHTKRYGIALLFAIACGASAPAAFAQSYGSSGGGGGGGSTSASSPSTTSSGTTVTSSSLNGGAPTSTSTSVTPSDGGAVFAGNVGLQFTPSALSGVNGPVTVSITAQPTGLPIPGGNAQYSPNGTVIGISISDQNGNLITTFPTPVPIVAKPNAADLAMAHGDFSLLTFGYFVDSNTPGIANPNHFPVGTLVVAPQSSVTTDASNGTITFATQAIGSVFAVISNPVEYVETTDPATRLFSSFDPATSQVFGTTQQFTPMQVVEPQIGNRLLVLNPDTNNFAYVDATEVGPAGPPAKTTAAAVVRGVLSH